MAKRIILIAALSIFLYWTATVALPILGVEATYRYKLVLRNTFAVSDIRQLILPQFHVDLSTGTFTTDGISIPAVFIDEPVVYNVDPNNKSAYMSALLTGIAHASSTAFPGEGGLGYYFAHSSSPQLVRQYNAVFYLLGKLNNGDTITLWHRGNKYNYSVYQKRITTPTDLSFLHQAYPTESIVLQTCWPPGTTLERLLVFAHKIQ